MATDWRMIRLEKDGPLAIVTLTNPPLNVLHPQMAAELDACFTGLATDADVVVAIVTGHGERAFCAGFDIKEFPNLMAPAGAERLTRALHASLDKIAHLGKPTIAAVNGLALGGGLELSMDCDLRIVSAQAIASRSEVPRPSVIELITKISKALCSERTSGRKPARRTCFSRRCSLIL